jgi:hypothetical protein
MAVELRNRLRAGLELEQPLPATLVFDYPTIEAVADYLLRELFTPTEATSSLPRETFAEDEILISTEMINSSIDLSTLSDEEVEALLLKKLENI